MGVIDDFPGSHDYVLRYLDASDRDAFARFDAAFEEGTLGWFRKYHRPVWDALHDQMEDALAEPAENGPAAHQ
ncbi:hypothetical protein ABZU75_02875 [Streptosporangium sp. NPDC005286]|uniref:hypothetical protein n=1 Tax=Streptosporangium sp. NPDC005286 TaxID=3154463 RepID=UPI0033A49BF7